MQLCNTTKFNGVSDGALRYSHPSNHFTTWNNLSQKFLAKYFPPSKTIQMRDKVTKFMQHDRETLSETWKRFQELCRRCPHHEVPRWMQIQYFYNVLDMSNAKLVDAIVGGALMRKTTDESFNLLDVMTINDYKHLKERTMMRKTAGVPKVDAVKALTSQVVVLVKKLETREVNSVHIPTPCCVYCRANHENKSCLSMVEQANYMGNFNRQQWNPNSNTYHPSSRNHSNFSYRTLRMS